MLCVTKTKLLLLGIIILVMINFGYFYHFIHINKNKKEFGKSQTYEEPENIIPRDHYNYNYEVPPISIPPVIPTSEYIFLGYMYKRGNYPSGDDYKVLPLYGKPYRGDFYKYFVEYKSGGQKFRKQVFKGLKTRDYSREIYDGDIIIIDDPINGEYIYKEDNLDIY